MEQLSRSQGSIPRRRRGRVLEVNYAQIPSMIREGIRECGVCGSWTSHGDFLPSGNYNPQTRTTPHDNFVCRKCQREARELNLLGKATEKWLLQHRHTA